MATIKDVAELAGLSVNTVSRVFNNRGSISDRARKKVADACKALNYQPSEVARSLSLKRTNFIGVLIPLIRHPFFSALVQAIEDTAAQSGYKIVLFSSNLEEAREREYLDVLRRNQVDGIIVSTLTRDVGLFESLQVPVVCVERFVSDTIPSVICDSRQGSILAADALLDRGCRHPMIILPSTLSNRILPASSRKQTFIEHCRARGVEVLSCSLKNYPKEDIAEDIAEALRMHPEADGIFATNDSFALQAMRVCWELGRRVPDDIQIVGYDDVDFAAYCGLSTIAQPVSEMGRYAVRLLLGRIAGEAVPGQINLPVRFVARRSTRRSTK